MSSRSYVIRTPRRNDIRLPTQGWIDLTYRCNNDCSHCWLRISPGSSQQQSELSFDRIRRIADSAYQLGCREWYVSGGEPMLRRDFVDILSYLSTKSTFYTLNTNGTLITPSIADLLAGHNNLVLVALYGADQHIHDKVTKTTGSFDACLRGIKYLQEAGAAFSMQIVPLRDNFHQLQEMIDLAKSLTDRYRMGASWLNLSAHHDQDKNREISEQRLNPEEINIVEPVRMQFHEYIENSQYGCALSSKGKDLTHFLESCVVSGKKFHVDAYGFMSLCTTMKEKSLRIDTANISFEKIWFDILPQSFRAAQSRQQHNSKCQRCEVSRHCQWCPAYAYLENKDLFAPIENLCLVAVNRAKNEEKWMKENYQLFEIAGMTVHVDSDIPFKENFYGSCFETFRTTTIGDENLYISHRIGLPAFDILDKAELVYDMIPWAIYRAKDSWIYLSTAGEQDHKKAVAFSIFNNDHSEVIIYHKTDDLLANGENLRALTAFPSDQVMLSKVLAKRQGLYLHSGGIILNNNGYLFVGHSGAGKSTIMKLLKEYGQILCDDRNIIRLLPEGYRVFGTWSHGELPFVANASAPLKAIVFLTQSSTTSIEAIEEKQEIVRYLLNRVIKPFCDAEWWNDTLDFVEGLAVNIPFYRLSFAKNKKDVAEILGTITGKLFPSAW